MPKPQKCPGSGRKSHRPSLADVFLAAPKLPKHEWRLAFGKRPQTLQTAHFPRWQLQVAKAKFSELFDRAFEEGPQVVTRRNKNAVVIIPEAEFRKLAEGPQTPQPGMLETLLKCPPGPELRIPRRNDSILDLPPVFD